MLWAEHPHPPTSLARPSRFRQLPLGAREACRGRADRGSRCDQSADAKPAMACPRSHPSRYTDNPGWYARWPEKRDTHALGSRQRRMARRLAERCGLFPPALTCLRSGSSPIPSTTASELAWCLTLAVGERGVTEAPRRPGVGMGYSRPTHSLTVEADYCLPPLRRYHSAVAAKLGASSSSSFSSNSSTPSAAGTYESIGSLSVSQSMLGTGSVCHGCVAESSSCRGCGCRVICQWTYGSVAQCPFELFQAGD